MKDVLYTEKICGTIAAIKHFAVHDGDGIRDTVFFKGCPLSCIWCHNPETQSFKTELSYAENSCKGCGACASVCKEEAIVFTEEKKIKAVHNLCTLCGECMKVCPTGSTALIGERREAGELAEYLLRDKPFFDESGGGVTLSGGECLSQPKFALALAKELKKRGVSVAIDTCGDVSSQVIADMLPLVDLWLYDIKAASSEVHKNLTGRGNERILDNLHFLSNSGARIHIRIPLVVGENDTEIEKIADLLSGLKGIEEVKVLKYSDLSHSKYKAIGKSDTLPKQKTTAADVEKAKKILACRGLNLN